MTHVIFRGGDNGDAPELPHKPSKPMRRGNTMKTFWFKVDHGSCSDVYPICAESYSIASNIIHTKFPPSAIISPVN